MSEGYEVSLSYRGDRLYTYINRHAGTLMIDKNQTEHCSMGYDIGYSNNSSIDPHTIRAYSLEHKKRYKIVIGQEEKYIYLQQYVREITNGL